LSTFYDVKQKIGEGAFGKVYLVTRKMTGATNVMKSMARDLIEDEEAFNNELGIQRALDHPHICRIFDTFDAKDDVQIILESCDGGSLEDAICAGQQMGEAEAHCLMKQLLGAVCYMHSRGVVHRDLKPDNMLLSRKGVPLLQNSLKLVDFGFARTFVPGTKELETMCGTVHFMAPEIISDDFFNEKCDIWSCGVILYMFLSGQPPFDDDDNDELLRKAAADKLDFSDEVWERTSPKAKLAIVQMCKVDPKVRFSAEAALHSPWMSQSCYALSNDNMLTSKAVVSGIQKFQRMSKAKKAAAYIVALNVTDAQQEQVAAIRRKFEDMDANGDGMLSLEEVQKGMAGIGLEGDDVAEMFKDIDQKGSGVVEWSEFLSLMADQKVLGSEDTIMSNKQIMWAAFKVLDQNNTQSVGAREIFDVMVNIDKTFTFEEATAFVAEADADGDGKIDFEEFLQLFQPETENDNIMSCIATLRVSGGGRRGSLPEVLNAKRKSVVASRRMSVPPVSTSIIMAPETSSSAAGRTKSRRVSMLRPELSMTQREPPMALAPSVKQKRGSMLRPQLDDLVGKGFPTKNES